jgi:outer membrane biosynthesis protein TonB
MSLLDYIRGKRHGKDARLLEREAMQDPFLSDAIDGFDTVDSRHAEQIDEMRRRISRRVRQTNRWMTYAGVAASLLVCLFLGVYYLFVDQTDDFLATSDAPIKQETPTVGGRFEDSKSLEEDGRSTNSSSPLAHEGARAAKEKRVVADAKAAKEIEGIEDVKIDVGSEVAKKERSAEKEDVNVEKSRLEFPQAVQTEAEMSTADVVVEAHFEKIKKKQADAEPVEARQGVRKKALPSAETSALATKEGIVTDENNSPLSGVSVCIDGSNRGVVTDIDGKFSIDVNPSDVLIFKYIGMQEEKLNVGDKRELAVVMKDDDKALDEVIVVAFGKQKKESLIGSKTVEPASTKEDTIRTDIPASAGSSDLTGRASTGSAKKSKEKKMNPEPVVGWKEYKKYLKQSLQRPTEGDCAQVKGTVEISFYVDKNGDPQHLETTKSLCPEAEEEAKRLIRQGYKWTPGSGRVAVKVSF